MSEPVPSVAPSESSMRTTALLMTHAAGAVQRLRLRQQERDRQGALQAAGEAGTSEAALDDAGVAVRNGMPRPIDQATFNRAVNQAEAGQRQPNQAVADKTYLSEEGAWAVFGQSPKLPGKQLGGLFAAETDAEALVAFIRDPNTPVEHLAQWETMAGPVEFTKEQQQAREKAFVGETEAGWMPGRTLPNPMALAVRGLDLSDPSHRAVADRLQQMNDLHPDVVEALREKQAEAVQNDPRSDLSLLAQQQEGHDATASANGGWTARDTVQAERDLRAAEAAQQQTGQTAQQSDSPQSQQGTSQPLAETLQQLRAEEASRTVDLNEQGRAAPTAPGDGEAPRVGLVSGDEQRQQTLVDRYRRLTPWENISDAVMHLPGYDEPIPATSTNALNDVATNVHNTGLSPENQEHCQAAAQLWDLVEDDGRAALAEHFPGLQDAMELQTAPTETSSHENAVQAAQAAQKNGTQRQRATAQTRVASSATDSAQRVSAGAAQQGIRRPGRPQQAPQQPQHTQPGPQQTQQRQPSQ